MEERNHGRKCKRPRIITSECLLAPVLFTLSTLNKLLRRLGPPFTHLYSKCIVLNNLSGYFIYQFTHFTFIKCPFCIIRYAEYETHFYKDIHTHRDTRVCAPLPTHIHHGSECIRSHSKDIKCEVIMNL